MSERGQAYTDLASRILLAVKESFSYWTSHQTSSLLRKGTYSDGKKNKQFVRLKRKRNVSSESYSESDSLSTPASQSPPRSDDEGGQQYTLLYPNKRPRSRGRRFPVGTQVSKVGYYDMRYR